MGNFARTNHLSRWQEKANPQLAIQVDDVVAVATSGPQAGLCGPFDLSATDGRQTLANIKGVSCHRTSVQDAAGIQERFFPNQDTDRFSLYIHVSGCDGNFGFIRNAQGQRITLNAEPGQPTKAYLATIGFVFIDPISD